LQLKRLDKTITKRKENLKIWLNSLSDKIFYKNFDTSGNSNFALPLILLKQDKTIFNKILQYLKTRKIEYRKGTAGGGNLTTQPFVKNIKKKIINNLQNSNHIHNFGLYLGNHTELKEKQIKSLAENLNKI
jgi:CDP-6-deoxy-D-xylo-4-hexulose-3-dehydrase